MPSVFKQDNGEWGVKSDAGDILHSDMTNAAAWRKLTELIPDNLPMKSIEPKHVATVDEQQDFYSQLLHIAESKNYKSGWAWHKFHEKFGHVPDGLSNETMQATNVVWGWLNRKAIARSKK